VTQLKVVSAGAVCSVLHEDPDLAEAVPHDRREQAISELFARELRLPAGPWSGDQLPVIHGGVGLLILNGMMIRRVGLEGRYGAELLGECDILRPWPGEDGGSATLATTTGWSVLAPSRIAVLDAQFARQMVRYPELVGRLVSRALQRSRHLTVNMAIVHQARVDIRLHMLMWHLAGRWGAGAERWDDAAASAHARLTCRPGGCAPADGHERTVGPHAPGPGAIGRRRMAALG
jgi:CRP/FNR family transcriptional regulator, cyclic AMP receptor protein